MNPPTQPAQPDIDRQLWELWQRTDKWEDFQPAIQSLLLQAKVSELEDVLEDGGLEYLLRRKDGDDPHSYVDRRIAELRAAQQTLSEKNL